MQPADLKKLPNSKLAVDKKETPLGNQVLIDCMLDSRTEMLKTVLDLRIKELPNLILNIKNGMKTVWKYQDDHTFLYGWCIGRLENILYRELRDFGGTLTTDEDWFIIRDLLELRRQQITKIIDDVLID